ncbi:hypothetical protein AKK85_06180 [Idiomarina sp. FenA--70]|nr:hypothetical protein [Idiomarina sp. FenA--70]
MLSYALPSAQYPTFIFVISLTVNDLNTQHNNKTRNIAEVNVPYIAGDTITY